MMKRLVMLLLLVLVLAGCGGQGGATTPEASAKNWVEAFFRADGVTMRANMCRLQSLALSDEVVSALSQQINALGTSLDLSGLTYTYNATAGAVTIGGLVRVTVAGQTLERPLGDLGLATMPVVQEDDGWKVCLSLSSFMGG